ncbi:MULTISPECIES: SAF domain-containing protein [unclassified Kitasatospora]|uniref:SAF domain-containing protein n=1 Tax=unclassified Kitasatospora TaxID=2633591 RepID=UPI0037FC4A1D
MEPEQGRATPHSPGRTLRARRRRPAVLAMAVALIAAGGLGGAVLYNSTGQRVAVLALARDVPYGQVVTDADLVVARIASDPALKPLGAVDRKDAVGMRAATDLRRGALLLKADLAQALTVQPGQLVVGVSAKRTQLPATRLQPGAQIVVVFTPDTGRPDSLAAVVTTIGRVDTDGSQVVDVAVPAADAARLAAWVASGRIQVVLAPRGAAAGGAPSGGAPGTPTPSGTAPSGTAPGTAAPSASQSGAGGA